MQISIFYHHYEINSENQGFSSCYWKFSCLGKNPVSLPVNPELMAQLRKQNKLPEGNRKQIDSLDQRKL